MEHDLSFHRGLPPGSAARLVVAFVLSLGAQLIVLPLSHAKEVDVRVAGAAKGAAGAALAPSPGSVPRSNVLGDFVTFDVPGAVKGTFLAAMSPLGLITGYYNDANFVGHGFLRSPDGKFVTFDVPGATSYGTYPSGINLFGAVTGSYLDANFASHGFLRARDGSFTTFDAPDALANYIGTLPQAVSLTKAVAGNYYGADMMTHGFFRSDDRKLAEFDAPGASSTSVADISWDETVIGSFLDATRHSHGFLRSRDGAFATIGPPETQAFASAFTFGSGLYRNPEGMIAGTYFQPISGNPFGGNYRVFLQAPGGAMTTFDAASYPPCCIWSFPNAINVWGAVAGSFNDGYTINHGFLRSPDGHVMTFDAPGAGSGFNQGTVPLGISAIGVIMGLYIDPANLRHGFTVDSASLSAK